MFKLTIENFQSIKEKTEIDFIEGVNLIIGPSNSGKSAVLRALRGLILNYKGNVKKYLTHNQNQIEVNLQLDDEEKYTWLKSDKGTIYKVEDLIDNKEEEYKKAGNNNIFDYVPEFPFVLRDKQLINTHTEHDGLPFPFNMSDLELFKMFEDLYNVSSSATILKFMKKVESQANTAISSLEENIARNKNRINAIIELEDKYNIEELEKKKELAENLINNSQQLITDYNQARENNKISKAIKTILENKQTFDLSIINDYSQLKEDYKIVQSNNEIENINIYTKEFDTSQFDSYKELYSDFKLFKSLEYDLNSLSEEEKELLEEKYQIEAQLAEIEICPLCGNKLRRKE